MPLEPDPSEPTESPRLNASHARAVRATFAHVSELLNGAVRAGNGNAAPFDRQRADISRDEALRLEELVRRIHAHMLQALDLLGIERVEPDVSARWAVRTALMFSDIALSELSPQGLRGYGQVGEAEGALIVRVANDLRDLVARATEAMGGD